MQFSDGSSAEGDVVVGADGADSVVRKRMFPESDTTYTGKLCLSGVVDMKATDRPFEVSVCLCVCVSVCLCVYVCACASV